MALKLAARVGRAVAELRGPGPLEVYFGGLSGERLSDAEASFFTSLQLSNGTYTRSAPHTLDDVNRFVAPLLPDRRPLRLMDVGASTALATVEWSEDLSRRGVEHEIVAGDLCTTGTLATIGRHVAVLWEQGGHPLAIQVAGLRLRLRVRGVRGALSAGLGCRSALRTDSPHGQSVPPLRPRPRVAGS